MHTLLIISRASGKYSEAYYWRRFVKPLKARGLRVCVFDIASFPNKHYMNVSIDARGKASGWIEVFEYTSSRNRNRQALDINEITLAWWLRPGPPPVSRKMVEEIKRRFAISESKYTAEIFALLRRYIGEQSLTSRRGHDAPSISSLITDENARKFAEAQSERAVEAFASLLSCPWVNRRETQLFLDENKAYQQHMAARVGLLVPHTLISNHAGGIRRFPKPRNGRVMVKTIAHYRPPLDQEPEFIYTTPFELADLASDPGVKYAPLYVQEPVPKKYEWRIVVAGKKVLGCRVDSQAIPGAPDNDDWRHYSSGIEWKPMNVPCHVQEKIIRLMVALGLNYGLLDMIELPDNEWCFLEVNTHGQYGWIKLKTISAVADMCAALC